MHRWRFAPFFIVFTVVLMSCSSRSVRSTGTASLRACDITFFSASPQANVIARLRTAVGGGQIEQGPFTFCLILYADPTLRSPGQAWHPSMTSAIPGIGAMALWVYHGPGIEGRITQSFGPLPDGVRPISGYYQLQNGQSGGRIGGGVLLPTGSRPGDSVELGTIVETPAGNYGAKITFTVADQGVKEVLVSGWQPSDSSESSLSP